MKRIISILLALAMVFALAACGSKTEESAKTEEPAQTEEATAAVANPMTEYGSLEEVNKAIGGANLCHPGIMGVSDESFTTIAGEYPVGQYKFTAGGYEYCLRASTDYMDISGYYSGGGTVFSGMDGENRALIEGEAKLARWYWGDYQYCLCVSDKGEMEDATFDSIVCEMRMLTANKEISADEATYMQLDGIYYDKTSQRATASISNAGEYMAVWISWSSSAAEYTEWAMTVTRAEDGKFNYSDCIQRNITYAEDGSSTEEIVSENGEGYFTLDVDYNLLWDGAADEGCRECVFEKYYQYDNM